MRTHPGRSSLPSLRRQARAAPSFETLERRELPSLGKPGLELLVRFRDNTPSAAIARVFNRLGARPLESFPQGPTVVSFASPVSRRAAADVLALDSRVVYAQANQRIRVQGDPAAASDFARQWGLGQHNGIDIGAREAWRLSSGRSSPIVAVLDSGIDLRHPEFAGRIWTNNLETPGDGIDNDKNGYVDDVVGWDFVKNTNNVQDDEGHGTHVAGIIGADGIRVAGVNPTVRIMPLKMIAADGSGTIDDAVRAIHYAVDKGARVINVSWTDTDWTRALGDALRYARRHNVVVVAAAGNESANNDVVPSYPANAPNRNIISVASINQVGRLSSFSNYGLRTVAIAAPGSNILSTVPSGYAVYSGTSMATPFVTGVVSLLIGQDPSLNVRQLTTRVLATARPLANLTMRVATGGMVNAINALNGRLPSRQAARAAGLVLTTGRIALKALGPVARLASFPSPSDAH